MNSNFGKIVIDKTIEYENFELIFMIGVGFTNKNNEWEYKSFIVEDKTKSSEKIMLDLFWKYIDNVKKEYEKENAIFIHWSQAEQSAYSKTRIRHLGLPEKNFIDLYQVFKNEPIVVKGALNYSLKSITKAMYKNNLITTIWDTSSPCANGLNAMLLAYQCYEKKRRDSIGDDTMTSIRDNNSMKEIEKYNEIDCKSMWDILKYLRANH
jgi:predicted RecB family nuclease